MFDEYRVSVLGDEKAMEMDGGDGYTTVGNVLNATVHLQLVKMVNFDIVFYHNKKIVGNRENVVFLKEG